MLVSRYTFSHAVPSWFIFNTKIFWTPSVCPWFVRLPFVFAPASPACAKYTPPSGAYVPPYEYHQRLSLLVFTWQNVRPASWETATYDASLPLKATYTSLPRAATTRIASALYWRA